MFLRKIAAPSGSYSVSKSLRFRSSASAYLNRTPSVAGNQTKFTISLWFKRGALTAYGALFDAYSGAGANYGILQLHNDDTLTWFNQTSSSITMSLKSTAVYRDPSAWYHVVAVYDSAQATASNRASVYVNGVQITSFSIATYPTLSQTNTINGTVPHDIARYGGAANYFDGYMAEVNFIDGQALTPSSFGTYDANGVWQPIKYSGSFGTNGFYLNFGNTTSTTTLGYDTSGNSNNWTTNNISLTAGSTYDSMTDSPTVTSATVANYATLNPVGVPYNTGTAAGGNLNWTGASTADKGMAATISMSSGKWYWECTVTATASGSNSYVGIVKTAGTADSNANRVYYRGDGATVKYGTATTGLATYTTGDVIGIAYDYSAQTLAFYKNNTLVTTVTSINLEANLPWVGGYTTTESWAFNAGQRPFTYTPPTGFNALNTYNLPTPTIANGAQYMAATTYTGTGASGNAVSNATNNTIGTTFQPDFVWIKSRSLATTDHALSNVVAGFTLGLSSNNTGAEFNQSSNFTSVGATGFTVQGTSTSYNQNAATYVGWQWKANGTGVSNTSGSITSTVSANTTAGFSVVTYTGTGANATVGHGLGVAPSMVIVKLRGSAQDWIVWQTALAGTEYLIFTTAAKATGATFWNSTTPTSTVFSIGSSGATNTTSGTYVAYCWAAVPGYSAFGSYTGNGSSDGTFVYTGFRPRYVLIKRTDSTGDWYIWDTSRNTYNVIGEELLADTSGAGNTATDLDILSNGFKIRTTTAAINASGGTFVYAAFAENPFQNSRAR